MVQDLSTSHTFDDNAYYKSALVSISMMNEFVTKAFPVQSYAIDQLDGLQLNTDEKQEATKILSHSIYNTCRRYVGMDSNGKMYFMNWTH